MQKINQIPISEFASLTNVTRQTLIYYDKINLFKPDFVNEIGYRYYSIKQIELISVITLLKELGMPLKEIKEYTQNKSPEYFLNLMTQQKTAIQEQKKHLDYNEMIINDKIQLIKEAIETPFDQITLQDIEETTFYISSNIANASELDFLLSINHFIDELKSHQLFTSQPIGVISNKIDIINHRYHNYNYLYVKIPNTKKHYKNTITIKGNYLIGYHSGIDTNINETYSKMIQKINDMKLNIGDYVYEEFVFDSVIKNNENEYITKIMIEIA